MSDQLAPHLARVRLAAEAAMLARLNAGVGFADARLPGQIYLRDPDARARLALSTLRSSETHRRQADEVAAALGLVTAALAGHRSRLVELGDRFMLDGEQRALLEVALAFELDADVRELACAMVPRRRPALWIDVAGELAGLSAAATARALHEAGRLVDAVIDVDGGALTGSLALGRPMLYWLAGDDRLTAPFSSICRLDAASDHDPTWLAPATEAAIAELAARARGEPIAVVIAGPRGAGRGAAARRLGAAIAGGTLTIPIEGLLELQRRGRGARNVEAALDLATLHGVLPYLAGFDQLASDGHPIDPRIAGALASHPGAIALGVSGRGGSIQLGRPTLLLRLPAADLDDRGRAWQHAAAARSFSLPADDAGELAARYVIGPGAIADVCGEAGELATALGRAVTSRDLEDAVSRRLSIQIGSFGAVISRKARWDEMVLPDDVVAALHDMIAMVGKRTHILERWGYARHLGISRGVSALFSGEPGTGKTMAASVIASELGLELIRIDLAAVISKYVGETEKNLAKIFDQAQEASAMLLFDEADALFGKRTEVRSAQDRYANLEVNYILQRMETFDGISILTTNLAGSIDQALQRRLNFRIRFPEPELDERRELWRRLLPAEAEVVGKLDFDGLAATFVMTGGYIKNAIVRAAVIAAREGRAITSDDLWSGAHAEYTEMGKVMPVRNGL